jgi:F1F0 ATPase subunit 2
MSEIPYIVLAVVAGGLLGTFFFSGLWWTVKKGVSSTHFVFLFIASMIVRTGVVLIGFYFISCGRWERFLGCLVGFIIAKIIIMRVTKSTG